LKQTEQGKVLLLLLYRSTFLFGIKRSPIWFLWHCHTDPHPLLLLRVKFFSEFKSLRGKNCNLQLPKASLLWEHCISKSKSLSAFQSIQFANS